MLRRRMGDARFMKLLGEMCRRFRNQVMSTEDFRKLAAEFLPIGSPDPQLEYFFDTWVYSTGEVTGRLRGIGAWTTVLSWEREPEIARRENNTWRLTGLGP